MGKRYIDAERLRGMLNPKDWGTYDERWRPESEFGAMIDCIPAADVAPVQRGAWIDIDDGCVWECDKCGFTIGGYLYDTDTDLPNFCPNCGNDKRQWLTDMLDFETQRAKEIWNE